MYIRVDAQEIIFWVENIELNKVKLLCQGENLS